jgi:hypothetical protein
MRGDGGMGSGEEGGNVVGRGPLQGTCNPFCDMSLGRMSDN